MKLRELLEQIHLVLDKNPEGRHGKGSAKLAKDFYGAKYGIGRGLVGNSYALPTKNLKPNFFEKETGILYKRYGHRSLTEDQIKTNIKELYNTASLHPELDFYIIYKANSTNLNGYTSKEIWDLFTKDLEVPINICFHESYKNL